jgi:hypothetical protein
MSWRKRICARDLNKEDDEYNMLRRLLQLLPRIGEDALRNEIENELKKKR